ncbi:HET-domain-containing protein [Lepidopterella palustris CBS 459.81]|uniref:HET-domain-containing protein n=1 Tax=Lepidopterella palustris CBS 459.81 TaxID=1314670 RepID=A0A8E2E046_9PEZI|nr:HET-domain-containing protein [Lepidopterella palustris CBS 459.81]
MSTSGDPDVAAREMDMFRLMMRTTFLTGQVPLGKEIEMRDRFSQYSFDLFEQTQDPSYLQDAIKHLEVILRRLPETSPNLPEYLDTLSYYRISEYQVTDSARPLEKAVELSSRAKKEATKRDLQHQSPITYRKILSNLGYAQSHRWGAGNRPQDLDDAIMNGRELVHITPRSDESYRQAVLNLSSRLRMRYNKNHDTEDYEAFMQCLNELLDDSSGPSHDKTRPYVLIQLGEIAHSKFSREKSWADLDVAIEHHTAAVELMGHREEKRESVLSKLCQMLGDRYDKTKDLSDGEKVISYSTLRVTSIPPSHPAYGSYLCTHMRYVRALVHDLTSMSRIAELVQSSSKLLDLMPKTHERYETCIWLLGDVLADQYILSGSPDDLMTFLKNAEVMGRLHNERARRRGEAESNNHKISWLQDELKRVLNAPKDNTIRAMACQQLRGFFKTACEENGIPNAAIVFWNQQGLRLKVYAEAIEANETHTEAEMEARVKKRLRRNEVAKQAEDERRRKNPWKVEEYKTEFGLRKLDIDPINEKIFFDIPGIVQDLFGYKDIRPLSIEDFVQQELQLEAETRAQETSEGRFPNPSLCRICRKVMIMVPLDDGSGFRWNPKLEFKPYGNFQQLFMRKSCAVCHLILELISDHSTGSLHRRLAAIDSEVQGTALTPVTLDSGDEVLQVSYGLREVGSLRILGDANDTGHQVVPISRLKKLISNCDHNHGEQCNGPALGGTLSKQIPMLQIDVVDECLIETTTAVRYFALSYVWGAVDMSKTLKANLGGRLMKGGLRVNALPKVIQDAIVFTKAFGERYLWVDALCIVQDDEDSKQRDIQQMDIVYSKAYVTIVALSGFDANAGLAGVRPNSRTPQEVHTVSISDNSFSLEYNPESDNKQDVRIAASPRTCALVLDTSKWNSRGWTYQERILSKRCLYFSQDTAYFQCRREVLDEFGNQESKQGPAMSVLANPLSQLTGIDYLKGDAEIRATFATYRSLVEQYTTRELTFGGDILHAFAGIWATLNPYMPGESICGLPTAFFDLALLWTLAPPVQRREHKVIGLEVASSRFPDPQKCPSWAWAGFVGGVEYRLLYNDERPFPKPMVTDYRIFNNDRLFWIRSRNPVLKDQKARLLAQTTVQEITDANKELAVGLKDLGPLVLQFEAFVVPLFTFKIGTNQEQLSNPDHVHATGRTTVCRLYDQNGKHCGIIFDMLASTPNLDASANPSLVGIVKYEETSRPYLGPKRVEGNITLFDSDVYPTVDEGSGLVDAFVVSWGDTGIAERITVARVHARAWENAQPVKQHVALG